MGRPAEWKGKLPIPCGPPSGATSCKCYGKPATCYLNFGCDVAGGGWYLCDVCCVVVAMWLEDKYADDHIVLERELL